MTRRLLPASLVAGALLVLFMPTRAQTPDQRYKTPPGPLATILDTPMLPTIDVSPGGKSLLLSYRPSLPPVTELSEPWVGLAGTRINPRNNGVRLMSRVNRLILVDVATGHERKVDLPAHGTFIPVFSPDGMKLALTHITDSTIRLLVADVATGSVKTLVSGGINGAAGECSWRSDSTGLLCYLTPERRGAVPVRSSVPVGPTIKENTDRTSNWIYRDLLSDAHDEKLFDYYFTSQLAWVYLSGKIVKIGQPAVFEAMRFEPAARSADDRHLIVTVLKKPYPYELKSNTFPRDIELWDAEGRRIRRLAHQPTTSSQSPQEGAAITGARGFQWDAKNASRMTWVEALDSGNPQVAAKDRDRLMQLDAPFTGEPIEILRAESRILGSYYTDAGLHIVADWDPPSSTTRYWLLDPMGKRKLWETGERNHVGTPFYNPGARTILQEGDSIYFESDIESPAGARAVLTRFNLKTLGSEAVWESAADAAELPLAIVEPSAGTLLLQRQTASVPPNVFVYDTKSRQGQAITRIIDPTPEVSRIQKRLLTYRRKDGVPLWGTLYLPPDYRPGVRLPTIVWTYPREYRSSDAAAEVTASTNTFTRVIPAHPLLFALHGYAVFFQPTIPIIGPRDTANDTYVEQLIWGAQAAVDHVVEIGVADRDRLAIGGHSYGAFTAANLLAHTDLFKAGVARSGEYNLTLQPMGFQNERRSLWQKPEVYTAMSPLWHADRIKEPLLLIHGGADENPGTPPFGSELFYMALRSLQNTVKYVTLPYEGHNYVARESHLHVIAETMEWFDLHVKYAGTKGRY